MGFSRPPLTVEQRLAALRAGISHQKINVFMDVSMILQFVHEGRCLHKGCQICLQLELIVEQGLLHPMESTTDPQAQPAGSDIDRKSEGGPG